MKRCLSLPSGIALALSLFAFAAAAQSSGRAPASVSGTVTTAGQPVSGARVFTAAGASATTGPDGHFRLAASTSVLHVQRDGYQPRTLLVNPPQTGMRIRIRPVSFAPAAAAIVIQSCVPLSREAQRTARLLGPADSPFLFTVPRHHLRVTELGGVNLDEFVLQPRHSYAQLTLWFGPRALPLVPEDRFFLQSAAFSQRAILMSGATRTLGIDSYGTFPGGGRWRHFSTVNAGATYAQAGSSAAQLFDAVIESLCAAPHR